MKEVNVKVLIPDDVDPKKVIDLSLAVRYQKENDKWQFVTMPFVLTDSAENKRDLISRGEVESVLHNNLHALIDTDQLYQLYKDINHLTTYSFPNSAEIKGDLISRQAVDELSKELVHTTRDKADFLCNFWERLQKLPSIENNGKWIPVSKRLPEIGHVVYCQLTDGSHEILCLDADFGRKFWVGRSMRETYDVAAWRELPEPYKGE